MKEIYKSKIYSNYKYEQDVYIVLYGRHPLIDDIADRYQIEVHVVDLEGWNTYIIKLFYDKKKAIKETIKLEDGLEAVFTKYEPEKEELDDFIKKVLDEAGYKYVSIY